jgi:hypothetical protein
VHFDLRRRQLSQGLIPVRDFVVGGSRAGVSPILEAFDGLIFSLTDVGDFAREEGFAAIAIGAVLATEVGVLMA